MVISILPYSPGNTQFFWVQMHKSDGWWEERRAGWWFDERRSRMYLPLMEKKMHEKQWFGGYRETVDQLERKKGGKRRTVEGLTGRTDWTTKRRLTVVSLLASSVDSSLDWQCDQLSAPAGITDRPPVFCQASVPACCSIRTCKHTHTHTHTHTHSHPILPPTQLSKRAQLNNESGHIPWRKGSREGKRRERGVWGSSRENQKQTSVHLILLFTATEEQDNSINKNPAILPSAVINKTCYDIILSLQIKDHLAGAYQTQTGKEEENKPSSLYGSFRDTMLFEH